MRLIDADALITHFKVLANMSYNSYVETSWADAYERVADAIDYFNTIDAVPVVHGRWVLYPRAHYFKCSECRYTVPYRKAALLNGERAYKYCPNCGAKMDEEVKEK